MVGVRPMNNRSLCSVYFRQDKVKCSLHCLIFHSRYTGYRTGLPSEMLLPLLTSLPSSNEHWEGLLSETQYALLFFILYRRPKWYTACFSSRYTRYRTGLFIEMQFALLATNSEKCSSLLYSTGTLEWDAAHFICFYTVQNETHEWNSACWLAHLYKTRVKIKHIARFARYSMRSLECVPKLLLSFQVLENELVMTSYHHGRGKKRFKKSKKRTWK